VKNPWIRLPTNAPFVLPEDAPLIERRNRGAPEETRIETDLIPEPFLGNPDAPILLLNLNPGYDPREVPLHTSEPTFIALSRANLSHEVTQYPFYLLDPSVDRSLGHQWWLRKLASLIESAGAQALAESLFCAEYFPYHSRRYRHSPTLLPSQFYTFELARRSAAKAKAIVLMRGAHATGYKRFRAWAVTQESSAFAASKTSPSALGTADLPTPTSRQPCCQGAKTRPPNNSMEPTRPAAANRVRASIEELAGRLISRPLGVPGRKVAIANSLP
jgi:hypothetical protein